MTTPILKLMESNRLAHFYLLTPSYEVPLDQQLNCLKNIITPLLKIEFANKKILLDSHLTEKIWNNQFPDIHYFDETLSKKFNYNSIQLSIQKSHYDPLHISKRYYLFKNCGQLFKKQIYNKLLKFFEEPPKNTVIIVFNPENQPVPATIKSRAVEIDILSDTFAPIESFRVNTREQYLENLKSLTRSRETTNSKCIRIEILETFEIFINNNKKLTELNTILKKDRLSAIKFFESLIEAMIHVDNIDIKGLQSMQKMILKVTQSNSVNLNLFDNILIPIRLLLHKYLK